VKINDALNLVIPITGDIKAYHSPISADVFEANYRLLSAAKSAMTSKGIHYVMDTGPRIAALILKDEAIKDAEDRGDVDARNKPSEAAYTSLMMELRRLTTILAPTPQGFDFLPVDNAIQQGFIDAEDWKEAESAISFFTCHYAMAKRASRTAIANATASVLQGSMTSLSLTEYSASLRESMQATNTPVQASSVPS
jgi:hypothetical protein